MKCGEFRKKVDDYFGGDLNAAEKQTLEKHAAECLDCAKVLAASRKIFNGLQKMGNIKAPSDFSENVRRRIQNQGNGLRKIFQQPFKIPLELAATLLIGVFIYRVILPHHPIGKRPHVEVRESSHLAAKKSDADLNRENVKQAFMESGREQKKETETLEDDVLSRQRQELQKDFLEEEKSEPARFDEKNALPATVPLSKDETPSRVLEEKKAADISEGLTEKSDSSSRAFSDQKGGLGLDEPKISPPMTSETVKSPDQEFRKELDQEEAQPKPVSLPGLVLEGSASSNFAAAGRMKSQVNEEPAPLDLKPVQQSEALGEKQNIMASGLGEEARVAESFNAAQKPPAKAEEFLGDVIAQPAVLARKAKVQNVMRDEKSVGHYVWQFSSEEIRKEMFLMIQEKGWKVESRAVRTYQILLPESQKGSFLEWLNAHGKLLSVEETAQPENSDTSQMMILDLEFEEGL